MKSFTNVILSATFGLLAGGAHAADPSATAVLAGPDGGAVGEVRIFEAADGLLFQAAIDGIAPGWHGFHVHELGDCGAAFDAAGGHYNPSGNSHGLLNLEGAHAGDLPNIHADENGRAMAHVHSARLSLEGGDAPVLDADGSAIIVHANPDSYAEDAGAGGRVACGVITRR